MGYSKPVRKQKKKELDMAPIKNGIFQYSWDNYQLYIDMDYKYRVEITDIVKDYNKGDLATIKNPLQKIYITKDTNEVYIYTNKWIKIDGGGSGDGTGTGGVQATFTGIAGRDVGSIKAGDRFVDATLQEIMDKMLAAPYAKPAVSIALTPSNLIYDIVSSTLSSLTITANVTKNSEDIAYVKYYVNGSLVNTNNNITGSGQYKYTYTPPTPLNKSFTVEVEVADKITKSVVKAKTQVTFIAKSYFGIVPENTIVTETEIKGLTGVLKGDKAYTASAISTPGIDLYHIVYAYPKSLGQLTSIKDALDMEYIGEYEKSTLKVDGIDYLCYKLKNAVSVTGYVQKYK